MLLILLLWPEPALNMQLRHAGVCLVVLETRRSVPALFVPARPYQLTATFAAAICCSAVAVSQLLRDEAAQFDSVSPAALPEMGIALTNSREDTARAAGP